MTSTQRLLRVELPLALPVIIAGVRTATVWTVGTATLSTPVGAPSLGNYIFSGLQTRNLTAILVGCIACAVLALTLDALVRLAAVGWTRGRRGLLGISLAALALLYIWTGATLAQELFDSRAPAIKIGAKTFTEQYILSDILAGHISHMTGRRVAVAQSLGSTVAFDALRSGEIDLYVEYSGTVWATIMQRTDLPAARAEVLPAVTKFLHDRYGIAVVGALGFENAYALAMRRDRAQQLGVKTISDLAGLDARAGSPLRIGGDYEFFSRSEWRTIQERYGLSIPQQRSMDSSLMYVAVEQGAVDVISAFSTDGRIAALDLVTLADDRAAIPPYDALILASKRVQSEFPDVIAAVSELSGRIDAFSMRQLNLAVDQNGRTPRAVAQKFLDELWSRGEGQ